MVKAAKILLILAIIVVALGVLARLIGYNNDYGIQALHGVTPLAFWRFSISLTGFSAVLCLLDLAGRNKPDA